MKRYIVSVILFIFSLLLVSCGSCDKNGHEHEYKEVRVVKEATCYSLGERVMECKCESVCTEEIGYMPHSYENGKCVSCGATEALTYEMKEDAGDYYVVTGYKGEDTEIVVPKQYNGLLVLKIGNDVFRESKIKKITFPDTLKSIGDGAFVGCSELEEVKLPSALEELGNGAFKNCIALSSVKIESAKLTKIEAYAFAGCSKIEKIHLNEGITEIGECAFEGTSGLKEVKIPASLTKIGKYGFDMYVERVIISEIKAWCGIEFENNLSNPLNGGQGSLYMGDEMVKSITIPSEITEIKDFAFICCGGIEEVIIGDNVKKIGINAFTFCKRLKKVTIADSVVEIGEGAFLQCVALEEIKLPNMLSEISDNMLKGCILLKEIVIPESITAIKTHGLAYCVSLEEVYIGKQIADIGQYAFLGCSKLTIKCEADEPNEKWHPEWNASECTVVYSIAENN